MKTIQEDPEMSSNSPEALEVYRAAWLILTKTEISIKKIDALDIELGLNGPRNGCLTRLLEILFGLPSTCQLEALSHDVFGRSGLKVKKGPGHSYVFRNCIFKGSPLFGHVAGLLSCILFGKSIGRMIVNKP